MIKRVLSLFLILTMLVGMLPVLAQAEPVVQGGDITVEGTNSLGTLLSEEIGQQQEEMAAASDGYAVVGLTVEGMKATVEYTSMEEATLVVGVYTEDGLQLLTSGKTLVNPEETVATVMLEGDIPEYFLASAYLLDPYDYSPLSPSYRTPMYTQEMQALLASTTEDYDADRILNLDEDPATNFAVYEKTTVVIEPEEGVNTVTGIDEENAVYTIKNVDGQITGLQSGDVFAYSYGENQILIVKVAAITVDGTTAVITGTDLELEEVFSHMKLESTGSTEDLIVDEATGDEGIEYIGRTDQITPRSNSSVSEKVSLAFVLEKQLGSVTFKGSLALDATVSFSYYVSETRQYIEFKTEVGAAVAVEVSGKAALPVLSLPCLGFSPVPGVFIGFDPQLVLEFAAKVEASFRVNFTKGFAYESGVGVTDLSTSPKAELSVAVEGTIFFGLDMAPKVMILNGWVAEVTLSALAGIELKAEMKKSIDTGEPKQPESRHSCDTCLSMRLYAKMQLSVKLSFLKVIQLSFDLTGTVFELGQYYYSFDQKEFGKGSCPNLSYRVRVYVKDTNGKSARGVTVMALRTLQTEVATTNSNGVAVVYLPAGACTFETVVDETIIRKSGNISGACTVTLDPASKDSSFGFAGAVEDTGDLKDYGKPTASGNCGANGSNVTWALYADGTLKLSGTGDMKNYINSSAPWNRYQKNVIKVVMDEGITNIGNYAFYCCSNLASITVSGSVSRLGDCAFYCCASLTSIKIPVGVTSIGKETFIGCSNLVEMTVPNGVTDIGDGAFYSCESLTVVTLPDSVVKIGRTAFSGCSSLVTLTIPKGVTAIEEFTFSRCSSLASVTIPDSVTFIGEQAFADCTSLTAITLPDNITQIENWTFVRCSNLTSVIIPEGVTTIGTSAFAGCSSLVEIMIPDTVSYIGDRAFSYCSSLSSIAIPDGISNIEEYTFCYCSNLSSIVIPDSVTSIGDYAFTSCSSLTDITLPEGVTGIGGTAFSDCISLVSIGIPSSVTRIGDRAFSGCSSLTDVYYNGTQDQWSAISIGSHSNSELTKATLHCTGEDAAEAANGFSLSRSVGSQLNNARGVFGGEYGSETEGTQTVKTANFEALVPGGEYVLLALVSLDVEEPLSADNLLFIDQGTAGEDGTLSFRYIQRVNTQASYVMACGASNRDLAKAQIVFPEMIANGETQMVQPVVVYEGKTLTEGQDYVITGDVEFTQLGEYNCFIRGIHAYTGLVTCSYTVEKEARILSGTVTTGSDGDTTLELLLEGVVVDAVTAADDYRFAVDPGEYTLRVSKANHVTRDYAVTLSNEDVSLDVQLCLFGDINGDSRVNVIDVARLYAHIRRAALLTDDYSIACANVNGGDLNIVDCAELYSYIRGTKKL